MAFKFSGSMVLMTKVIVRDSFVGYLLAAQGLTDLVEHAELCRVMAVTVESFSHRLVASLFFSSFVNVPDHIQA